MSSRTDKHLVRELLLAYDLEAVVAWALQARAPQRTLMSLTFDHEKLIRWRSIQAMGRVAALQASRDLERVRDRIRRLRSSGRMRVRQSVPI